MKNARDKTRGGKKDRDIKVGDGGRDVKKKKRKRGRRIASG